MIDRSFKNWHVQAALKLKSIHGEREANNILKYLLQDLGLTSLNKSDHVPEILEHALDRLLSSEPLPYVTGKAYFMDLILKVTPDVLIPRPETEELVHCVIQNILTQKEDNIRILDLGTGSGCIPLALKKRLPNADIHAVDISRPALEIAQENATMLDLPISFHCLDILAETEKLESIKNEWDIIVSNPPYIPIHEQLAMDDHVVKYEPPIALFTSNPDGQEFYRAIASFASKKLSSNGYIFLEVNEFRAEESEKILTRHGFHTALLSDINGKKRILSGRKILV